MLMQEDPDAIVAVGVDGNAEAQITRKRKRNEAFQHQQEMERVRAEEESRAVSWDEVDGKGVFEEGEEIEGDDENDNENNDEDDDDEDDNEYLPPTHGHRQMCNISIHQYLLVNDADEVCSRTLDLDVFL